jgi:hypothetical protein
MTAAANRDGCSAGHLTSGFVQASGDMPAQRMDPAAIAADTPCLIGALPMRTLAADTQAAEAGAEVPHDNASAQPAPNALAAATAAAGEGTNPSDQPLMQLLAEVSAARWRAGKAYAMGQGARQTQAQHQTLPERLLAQVAHPPVSCLRHCLNSQ